MSGRPSKIKVRYKRILMQKNLTIAPFVLLLFITTKYFSDFIET